MIEPELRELDPLYSDDFDDDFTLDDSLTEKEEFIDRAYSKYVYKEENFDGEAYEITIGRAERDVLNISPEDIGELRDIQTELRVKSDETSDTNKDRIDAIIDKWNNFNPEFVRLKNEVELASKDLDSLYKERNKLQTQLTLEETLFLEDKLTKVEYRIRPERKRN